MFGFLRKNNPGNQKAIMIALLAVAVILVALVVVDLMKKPVNPAETSGPASSTVVETATTAPETAIIPAGKGDEFKAEVAADTVVPNTDTKLTEAQKKEVALPTVVVPAAPGASSKFRNFKVNAESGAFVPTKVIVNVGDTVHIDFTAVDNNYDIVFPSYNMSQAANKGETKIIEFQALVPGDFTYYCSVCGGPDKGPKGHIIVVK